MKRIYVAAVGSLPSSVLDWIAIVAEEWYPFPVRRMPPLHIPEEAYDSSRGQYQSVHLMRALAQAAPADTARLVGATEVDLAIPMLSFLFGQAQLDGPIAVISVCRLRQEFYGLPGDEELLRARIVKETLHELGHRFGLTHCPDPRCVMSLATHISLVDQKDECYCVRCKNHLAQRLTPQTAEPVVGGGSL